MGRRQDQLPDGALPPARRQRHAPASGGGGARPAQRVGGHRSAAAPAYAARRHRPRGAVGRVPAAALPDGAAAGPRLSRPRVVRTGQARALVDRRAAAAAHCASLLRCARLEAELTEWCGGQPPGDTMPSYRSCCWRRAPAVAVTEPDSWPSWRSAGFRRPWRRRAAHQRPQTAGSAEVADWLSRLLQLADEREAADALRAGWETVPVWWFLVWLPQLFSAPLAPSARRRAAGLRAGADRALHGGRAGEHARRCARQTARPAPGAALAAQRIPRAGRVSPARRRRGPGPGLRAGVRVGGGGARPARTRAARRPAQDSPPNSRWTVCSSSSTYRRGSTLHRTQVCSSGESQSHAQHQQQGRVSGDQRERHGRVVSLFLEFEGHCKAEYCGGMHACSMEKKMYHCSVCILCTQGLHNL